MNNQQCSTEGCENISAKYSTTCESCNSEIMKLLAEKADADLVSYAKEML